MLLTHHLHRLSSITIHISHLCEPCQYHGQNEYIGSPPDTPSGRPPLILRFMFIGYFTSPVKVNQHDSLTVVGNHNITCTNVAVHISILFDGAVPVSRRVSPKVQ